MSQVEKQRKGGWKMKTIGNYVLRFHNLLSQQKLREKAEEMHKLNNKLKSKTK